MVDFFIRNEDEKLAKNAEFLDSMDLIQSPRDGALVAVAERAGAHVCWQCGELFDQAEPKLRGVEVSKGYARVLLHAKCVFVKTPRSFFSLERGLQARRYFAGIVKKTLGLEKAAEEAASAEEPAAPVPVEAPPTPIEVPFVESAIEQHYDANGAPPYEPQF